MFAGQRDIPVTQLYQIPRAELCALLIVNADIATSPIMIVSQENTWHPLDLRLGIGGKGCDDEPLDLPAYQQQHFFFLRFVQHAQAHMTDMLARVFFSDFRVV